MNLCLDIGNTRTKAVVFDGRSMIKESLENDFRIDVIDTYQTSFPFKHIIVSSSISLHKTDIDLLKKYGKLFLLNDRLPVPVKVDYETPETLGNDRIAAACGASQLFRNQNSLVVDAGTCVTYDFVDANGVYRGGNIAPGIDMRLKAMHEYTSKLPLIEKANTHNILGKSTEEALRNGAVSGVIFELEALLLRLMEDQKQINIILTGGNALFLAENVKKEIFVLPNLVLQGLNEILLYNLTYEE